jgi:quinoprotein glucose dehydrogenase
MAMMKLVLVLTLTASLTAGLSVAVAGAPQPTTAKDSGWLYYGGDQGGRHYSANKQITKQNVKDLDVAWIHKNGDMETFGAEMSNTSAQATPILLPEAAGDALVYCTVFNRVIALDPASGKERWQFDPKISHKGTRTFRCRGVSYAEEKSLAEDAQCRHRIILATHDRSIWAIDSHTGKPCTDFGQQGQITLYGKEGFKAGDIANSSAPAVGNGVIVVGSAIVDFDRTAAPRGTVEAFSSLTGKPVWSFDPLVGEEQFGAANVWAPISIDEKNNLVFLPTSAISADYYGGGRHGSNLYANSLVALDLTSGEIKWHYQHVRHDLWDYDTPAQPILFQWNKKGKSIPAVAQLTKQGFVFIFNRLTGESLWEITELPVPPSQIPGEYTSATQPKPIAPPALIDSYLMPKDAWGLTPFDQGHCEDQLRAINNLGMFTPNSEKLTLMYPGSLGGPNWGGGALLADKGILLVNINNVAFTGQLIKKAQGEDAASKADHPTAGKRMKVPMKGTPYAMEIGTLQSFLGIPCNEPPWGKVVAVDLINGTILWDTALGSIHEMGLVTLPFHVDWGTPNLGGGIATAGGLFFIGATMDRQIRAFDVDNGETLWKYTLPIDATATPMTYQYKGRQYVVINAGGHAMFHRGQGDYLYAFALPE